jgi:hypothetical protein
MRTPPFLFQRAAGQIIIETRDAFLSRRRLKSER